MAATLHVGVPPDRHAPGLVDCVRAFIEGEFSVVCTGWKTHIFNYDQTCSFNINDLCSAVVSAPGPVLLLHPVKNADHLNFRARLGGRQNIVMKEAFDTEAIRAAVAEVKQAHDNGDPHISRDQVVALLIMRKLDQERMWMGHNKKGCMWADDIPNGRGVDEKFKSRVAPVLNILLQAGLLDTKRSKGKNKYALHPDRRELIMGILETRQFPKELEDTFARCRETVSCRELDLLDEYVPANLKV